MTMKRYASVLTATAVALGIALVPAAPAQAATKCTVSGNGATRTCYTTKNVTKTVKVIETVVLRNKKSSKKPVKVNCSFEKSWSRVAGVTTSAGVTVGGSVEAGIMGVVKAAAKTEYNLTVGASFSQSAAAATKLGGSTTLRPGYKMVCERKTVLVSASVVRSVQTGTKKTDTHYKVKHAPQQRVAVDFEVSRI